MPHKETRGTRTRKQPTPVRRYIFAACDDFGYRQRVTALVHAALRLRRAARASVSFLVAALLGAALVFGFFKGPEVESYEWVLVGVWLTLSAAKLASRRRRPTQLRDTELGVLLIVGTTAIIELLGGLTSSAYPLLYLALTIIVSFGGRMAGGVSLFTALALEASLHFITSGHHDLQLPLTHAAFLVCFAAMSWLYTRAEIARVRETSRRELDSEKEKIRSESRMFRLVSAPSAEGGRDEERLVRSSLEELHHQLYHTLKFLHQTLELNTCVLLMRGPNDADLRITELCTQSSDIAEGPFATGEGAVGAVIKRQMTTNLENLKPGYRGLCYYAGPTDVTQFLGVPVFENGQIRGVLCADRTIARAFTSREEKAIEAAVDQVVRALQNERVFVQLESTKREQVILHKASVKIGAAIDEVGVLDSALDALSDVCPYDFAAVTYYDATDKKHSVRRTLGKGAEDLATMTFSDNASLTAMAVKTKHYLPYRGDFDAKQQHLFTKRHQLRGMKSLLVLPLLVREDAIGTLVVAAERSGAFGDSIRRTLQVLSNQLAVSISNAQAVRRLEEMATTDGLTGCLNKRAFLSELDKKFRSSVRFGKPLSLIVTDIDHFKSVNDTYGHATGDVVIKELGAILRRMKRETDIVARFGGEEFCVLCEETDAKGAELLAERVREALMSHVFTTELGKLRVTASLGVATSPFHADSTNSLFEAADKALYAAKHGGRNQVQTSKSLVRLVRGAC